MAMAEAEEPMNGVETNQPFPSTPPVTGELNPDHYTSLKYGIHIHSAHVYKIYLVCCVP